MVVISGRELDDLRQKVDVEGLTYAACHGLHVMHADGQTYRHTISQGILVKSNQSKVFIDYKKKDTYIISKGPHSKNVLIQNNQNTVQS